MPKLTLSDFDLISKPALTPTLTWAWMGANDDKTSRLMEESHCPKFEWAEQVPSVWLQAEVVILLAVSALEGNLLAHSDPSGCGPLKAKGLRSMLRSLCPYFENAVPIFITLCSISWPGITVCLSEPLKNARYEAIKVVALP